MQLNSDISNALEHIEAIKRAVDESDDPKLQATTADSLKTILDILQDPVFRSIIQIQDSVSELNSQISQHPSILPSDFDINLSGDLILNVPPSLELYEAEYPDEQRVPSAQLSPRSPTQMKFGQHEDLELLDDQQQQVNILKKTRAFTDLNRANDEDRPQSSLVSESTNCAIDIMQAEWVQVQSLELVNDGTGLGFGIIGARNNSGVIVKTIKPGGVADRDERLLSGDHILQIGEVNLHEMGSEQVANVLRQSGTHVRLVVARPIDPIKTNQEMENTAIVPARLLADPNELERYLNEAGYGDILGITSTPSTPTPVTDERFNFTEEQQLIDFQKAIATRPPILTPGDLELPETERFVVELKKDANGLGITIAGYVCEKEELSGIFVKSVSPGSAADLSGRIQVNDRIIEVDKKSLQGVNNHQAVEVLKQSGTVVSLCLERYLRGPKYEQLQQAIAANELKPSTPSGSGTIFTGSRPHSRLSMGSQQNVGSVEGITRSTTASPYVNTPSSGIESVYDTPNPPKLFEKPAVPPKESAALINARKLINARDSLETKVEKTTHGRRHERGSDSFESNEEDERPKYWVEPILTKDAENAIINKWRSIIGQRSKIIVAQIRKFAENSGLGISLEGTVDVEGGREVRPHHYIRSILKDGPVGMNALLCSGDELLEVNGQRLLGMNHLEVVAILKELPQDVRMVCSRSEVDMVPFTEENVRKNLVKELSGADQLKDLGPASDRLVKAKSDGSLATSGGGGDDSFSKLKSRSLEPLTGLAMWSSEPQIIELIKGERGLGFSILDYQDPLDANDTLIVIRSLVPGGVAQLDGRLIPGDRLLFVNDINLENSSLDQAVQALKGAPKGVVRIGVAKPLPMTDTSLNMSNNQSEVTILPGDQNTIPEWKNK